MCANIVIWTHFLIIEFHAFFGHIINLECNTCILLYNRGSFVYDAIYSLIISLR